MSNLDKVSKSKIRDMWETPDALFNVLDSVFRFRVDVCAVKHNRKVQAYLGPDVPCEESRDGLEYPWHELLGPAWCNPPYSDIMPWVRKAKQEAALGCTSVILIPVASDTKWWREAIDGVTEVRFLHGRVQFEPPEGIKRSNNPTGSAIFIFKPNSPAVPRVNLSWNWKGLIGIEAEQ